MSKRAQLNAAKKRALRNQNSVQKRKQAQREQTSYKPVRQAKFNAQLDRIKAALDKREDSGIKELASSIGGVKTEDLSKINTGELIQNTRTAIGDVFKLFSYVALGLALAKQGKIEYTPSCDIMDIARSMTNLDQQFTKLDALVKENPEEFVITVFDMGSEMETRAHQLYTEITALEGQEQVIGGAIDGTAKTLLLDHPEMTMDQARIEVTQSVAYALLEESTVIV